MIHGRPSDQMIIVARHSQVCQAADCGAQSITRLSSTVTVAPIVLTRCIRQGRSTNPGSPRKRSTSHQASRMKKRFAADERMQTSPFRLAT